MSSRSDLAERSQLAKLRHYSKENGLLYALLSALGRKSAYLWGRLGPALTRGACARYFRLRVANSEDALLNVGSGSNRIPGAFNVDVDPRADAFIDLTKPLPLPDQAFAWVYGEEVIEHVDQVQGAALLRECYRVLRTGGTIRITTPDLEYFCQAALQGAQGVFDLNQIFYEHGHRFIYSRTTIEDALRGAGFAKVHFSEYQDPSTYLGPLDSHADRFGHSPSIAIYVEATRE